MKTQVTSILLCALVCSTLGLDYLSALGFAHEVKLSRKSLSLRSNSQERPAESDQCALVCKGGSNSTTGGGLQILVNVTTNLFAVVNVTAGVSIVFDVEAKLVGIFNGTSGAVIVVNIETGSGIYIAADKWPGAWLSIRETFEIYFETFKVTSLRVILDLKVGVKFEQSSVSTDILIEIGYVLSKLSYEYRLQIESNIKISLSILLEISSSFSAVLGGSLKGIFKFFDERSIIIYGDLTWLFGVFNGLEIIILRINGGLETLYKAGVRFNFKLLLASRTGIQFFINLLLSIVVKLDLSIIRGINEVSQVLRFISAFSGNDTSGLNGVFHIMATIANISEGNGSVRVLVEELITFSVYTEFTGLSEIFAKIIKEGLWRVIQYQESHNSSSISVFKEFVENLDKGTFTMGSVNISALINTLLKGPAGRQYIQFVVTVLLSLSVLIKASVAISTLVMCLLSYLTNIRGIIILKKVIPGLPLSTSDASNGVIYKIIFEGLNRGNITVMFAHGFNIIVVLQTLPIISQIYSVVSVAVEAVGLTLKKLLDESPVIREIVIWFKWAIHERFGITIGSSSGDNSTSNSTANTNGSYTKSFTARYHWTSHILEKSGHAHSNNNVRKERSHNEHHKV